MPHAMPGRCKGSCRSCCYIGPPNCIHKGAPPWQRNYGYEKRQRELAKKKKKEEKALAKNQRKTGEHAPESGEDGEAVSGGEEGGTTAPEGSGPAA